MLSGFNVKPSEAMTVELGARKAGCSLAARPGRLLGASWLEKIVNVSYDSRDPFMHNYTNSLNSQGHQRLHSHLFELETQNVYRSERNYRKMNIFKL